MRGLFELRGLQRQRCVFTATAAGGRETVQRRLEAFAQIVNHAILLGHLRVARLLRRRLGRTRLVHLPLRAPHDRLELVMRARQRVQPRLQRRHLRPLFVGRGTQVGGLSSLELCASLRVVGERVRGREFGALPFRFRGATQRIISGGRRGSQRGSARLLQCGAFAAARLDARGGGGVGLGAPRVALPLRLGGGVCGLASRVLGDREFGLVRAGLIIARLATQSDGCMIRIR